MLVSACLLAQKIVSTPEISCRGKIAQVSARLLGVLGHTSGILDNPPDP